MDLRIELKNRRKELGLTMLEVAQKVGVSEATISRWESGDIANMRRDKIVLLAKALEVSPSFIMGWENESDIIELGKRIKQRREELGMAQDELAKKVGYTSRSSVAKVETNANGMVQSKLIAFAKALQTTPAFLMGWEDDIPSNTELPTPNATSDFVTFPVIGEIAAGYDSLALEDWNGETVDIPSSYFKGRDKSEFFVLEVKGDSMYPEYQEGDRVLILKQSTLEYSGQVGAVLYEDTRSTLKKVEFAQGQDWMKLVPINPSFKPQRIEGEALEHCKIIGIPRMLIRDIKS